MKKSAVMNTLKKKIREHKYKFTTQRQVILQAFLESKENHMCAEDVYEFVRDNNPEIGLATVYRSLELFTSLELLKKLDFGDGRSRYELNDHNLAHSHYHLICLKCGKVIEFSYDFMNKMEEKINLEKSLAELEDIAKALEQGDLTIDEAMEKYERGVKLARSCTRRIGEVKQRIEAQEEEK